KHGRVYLTDRTAMGKLGSGSDGQIQQAFQATPQKPNGSSQQPTYHIHSGAVFWEGPSGPTLYMWPENMPLTAYAFQTASKTLDTNPAAQSTVMPPLGMPGGSLSVSANGSAAGTGIVWAALPLNGNANQAVCPGVLRAFDAADVTKELWNSTKKANDDPGNYAKFVPPTIANGKLYLATFSNQLVVY